MKSVCWDKKRYCKVVYNAAWNWEYLFNSIIYSHMLLRNAISFQNASIWYVICHTSFHFMLYIDFRWMSAIFNFKMATITPKIFFPIGNVFNRLSFNLMCYSGSFMMNKMSEMVTIEIELWQPFWNPTWPTLQRVDVIARTVVRFNFLFSIIVQSFKMISPPNQKLWEKNFRNWPKSPIISPI